MTYKETMTSDFFEAWFKTFLLPTLDRLSIIIMDNARSRGIDFYHFLLTYLSIILLSKHEHKLKNTSEKYCQIAILFLRYFCPTLVSINYKYFKFIAKKDDSLRKSSDIFDLSRRNSSDYLLIHRDLTTMVVDTESALDIWHKDVEFQATV